MPEMAISAVYDDTAPIPTKKQSRPNIWRWDVQVYFGRRFRILIFYAYCVATH